MDIFKKIAASQATRNTPIGQNTGSSPVVSKPGSVIARPVIGKTVTPTKGVPSQPNVENATTGVSSVPVNSLSKPGLVSPQKVQPPQVPVPGVPKTTGVKLNVGSKPVGSSVGTVAKPAPAIAQQPNPPVSQGNGELEVKLDTFNEGKEKYTQEEVATIKENLEFIEQNLENPEIVGESVKLIMLSLLDNPNLEPLLEHKDIGLMVRGLRASYGVHVAKAETRKAGGPGSRGGKKGKGAIELDVDFSSIFGGGVIG